MIKALFIGCFFILQKSIDFTRIKLYNVISIKYGGINKMPRRKTDEEFKKEVRDLVGNEYTFIEPYQGTHTKIEVKHNDCGNIYKVEPNSFLHGSRCRYCYGKIKKTDTQFKKEVFDLVGDEYEFLESYVNNQTKLKVKHNKCGSTYRVVPSSFLQGSRCPYCAGLAKKTDAQFKHEVKNLVGNEYEFLDTYVNSKTKIKVKHNKCGNVYKVKPNAFLMGNRCPYCAGHIKKTNEQFKKEIFDSVGGEYTFLDSYVDNKTKLRVRHNNCGHIYEVAPTDFFSKHSRCPYCNSPKGEIIITKILNNLNIYYEPQKTFPDLKDTQPLSYDFYIPSQNILIEYQGIQHYQPVDYFGGNTTFKYQQKHDKMKLYYAKEHNYTLIAIPYTEDTFSRIKRYLLQHGLTK